MGKMAWGYRLMGSWNDIIQNLPGAHFLQTTEWANIKGKYGWCPTHLIWTRSEGDFVLSEWVETSSMPDAAALILERSFKVGGINTWLRILYIPKGPLLDWENKELRQKVLSDLRDYAKRRKAIFLKIDPDILLGVGISGENSSEKSLGNIICEDLSESGWFYSTDQIQFKNTVYINLFPEEDILIANMKQKTRYNLRLAIRKGVNIRTGSEEDLEMLYHLYAETSIRDGFVIREKNYYLTTWKTFLRAGMAEPLIAEYDGTPIAAIIPIRFGQKTWYVYGMSRDIHRDCMPNYLLQWEAMVRAKKNGSLIYDLWGAPDNFDEADPLLSVYRFKEGLGGGFIRTIGAWDLPIQPGIYSLFTHLLPKLLRILRRRGIAKVKETVQT